MGKFNIIYTFFLFFISLWVVFCLYPINVKTAELIGDKLIAATPELGTLEWDFLNSDRLIILEINNKRRTRII